MHLTIFEFVHFISLVKMGDVADILGLSVAKPLTILDETAKILNDKPKGLNAGPKLNKKPKGMSREVFSLLGADSFVPATMPVNTIGFKSKRLNATKGKWTWKSFTNSARTDNQVFYHWVKADMQYNDYPYAKFNVVNDPISFTDEEYNGLLTSTTWTKEETNYLLELISKYGLRWAVITDRYDFQPSRATEDLQYRYYFIMNKLKHQRSNTGTGIGGNISLMNIESHKHDNQTIFNFEHEKRRRYQLEIQFRK